MNYISVPIFPKVLYGSALQLIIFYINLSYHLCIIQAYTSLRTLINVGISTAVNCMVMAKCILYTINNIRITSLTNKTKFLKHAIRTLVRIPVHSVLYQQYSFIQYLMHIGIH